MELLLTIINRPNHGIDRQTRAIACECLRQLELAVPCILSDVGAPLWGLCQSERTHAAQSYVLLLAAVVCNIVQFKPPNASSNLFSSSTPLIPFNMPKYLSKNDEGTAADGDSNNNSGWKDTEVSSYKEVRRIVSFLLDWPLYLTSFGVLEFMEMIMPVAKALELQPSLLKVQFSGLLYTYDPLLCHAFLEILYLRFLDSFEGQETEIAQRLVFLSKDSSQNHLVFRLLVLHWLLCLIKRIVNREPRKKKSFVEMSLSFYPNVFEPLALKSLKLDLLAFCSVLIDELGSIENNANGSRVSVVKLFEDGLVCVSSFKWLPPWSTETAVAFRTFLKFFISSTFHMDPSDSDASSNRKLLNSSIFLALQRILVDSALEFQGLVPLIVAFVDRLLRCYKHSWLGEFLLKTFNDRLLPQLKTDYRLGYYFPILEKIAENNKVSPGELLELLINFMVFLTGKHGPDTGLKSWNHGSKVLAICRTMLINHHSSSLFVGLSRLLALACLCFPDLEVRDSARIYLRMLISVPGKKLRNMLNIGEQLPGISPSTHSSSFFNLHSPRYHEIKKSRNISSYIHLERVVPLSVKQSWSLSFPTRRIDGEKLMQLESTKEIGFTSEQRELQRSTSINIFSDINRIGQPREPLRVMDSKISEIIGILREHFMCIPDFRHMQGLKIKIPCSLRVNLGLFHSVSGTDFSATADLDALPALYATVLKFASSAPYGSIPVYHVPFLLAEPAKSENSIEQNNLLDIVPFENGSSVEESSKAPVVIELEPREPLPGLVDVSIEANTDNGQIIQGQLHSITIGMEDMFLKAIVPEDVPADAISGYYAKLFNALWEACGTSSSTGRETFALKGGKGVAAINGTQSVKLLETPVFSLIQAVERCMARFVVSIIGEPLVNMVKEGGIIRDVVFEDANSDAVSEASSSNTRPDGGPLYLQYRSSEDENWSSSSQVTKKTMGSILILIFLPPRFHLLFQMEVCDVSTLVRIRTDYWPCLAYVDDLLENLFYN